MNFSEKVLEIIKKVPKGKVTTYKEIGKQFHKKGQIYRAVGRALNQNTQPVIIPCHRVVKSDGSIGGYSRGIQKKILLLKKEGVEVKNNKIVDFKKKIFKF